MAQSRQRHKHHAHTQTQPHSDVPKTRRSAALLMAIFIGIVGLAIGGFASGMSFLWTAASTALGVIAGALIGHGIDRTIEKK